MRHFSSRERTALALILAAALAGTPSSRAQEPGTVPEQSAPAKPDSAAPAAPAATKPAPTPKTPEELALETATDQAIRYVLMHESLDPSATVQRTGQPLPTNGTWSVDKQRPPSCPQEPEFPGQSCLKVLYQVPDAGVSCEWVVLPSPNGFSGKIIEQNADSVRYFIRTLTTTEVRSMIASRQMPLPPRDPTVQGTVQLKVLVGSSGDPTRAYVVSGPDDLRQESIAAATQWHFKPLMAGSRGVPFETTITFQYSGTNRVLSRP